MAKRIKPARVEDVVDAAKLRAQLSAAALDCIGQEAALKRRARELIHGALFRGRAIAKERLDAGESGYATARLIAKVADVGLGALHDFTTTHVFRARNPTAGEKFAVVAVGGYGRGGLAPSSDIDLLFLRAYKQTPWAESVIEYMLYMLWDMSLKVGHAARSIDECLKLARADHTIQTALLDLRFIAGDRALAEELKTRFRKDVVAHEHTNFIAAKLAERDERHARAGASRYMVEPNLKEGKGGLRDLHTLYWMARHVYGLERADDYVSAGVFTPNEARRFRRATEFFWTVRCHLHFLTGRAEERLSFDLQPEIAARMGYAAHGDQQAVERFMSHYFLVAKDVGVLTRSLCAKLERDHAKGAPRGMARLFPARQKDIVLNEPGFCIEGGRLMAQSAETLDAPLNLLRVFEIADRRDLDVHPALYSEIQARLRRITPDVRASREASEVFLSIAASKRNPAAALRLMNEAGVLGRFVPEFGRVVAQMQFNMYHHYTVDEHTLRAIAVISDIEHGRCAEEHPLATDIFPKIVNRRALYLAMLLHDTGKGAGDQQIMGEAAAHAACRRLGLMREEVELVGWLVRHHLLMSDVAQRRDIGDPRTIAQFADTVGAMERLRLLLVLTVADIRAVGPGVWNGWKGQLLRDLYGLTQAVLQGGRTDEEGVRVRLAARADEARAHVRDALGASAAGRVDAWMEGLADPYWLSSDVDALIWHAQEIDAALQLRGQGPAPIHVAARPRGGRGVCELLVYAPDRTGLFASLTAAIANCGADIVDARVNTTRDGFAFDVFSLQTIEGRAFGDGDARALSALTGRVRAAAADNLAPPAAAPASRRAAAFAITPWVRFDNDLRAGATLIEVSGRDRPGLLADLSFALAERGLSIESAHINSRGARAEDAFYVRAPDGGPVTDAHHLAALRAELIAVLQAYEPTAPTDPARRALAVARARDAR